MEHTQYLILHDIIQRLDRIEKATQETRQDTTETRAILETIMSEEQTKQPEKEQQILQESNIAQRTPEE